MKFSIETKTLETALKKLNRVIPVKKSSPITSAFYFSVGGTGNSEILTLQANNLQNAMKILLPCEAESIGEFILNRNSILNIVQKISSERVYFSVYENSIQLKADSAKFNLPTAGQVNEFPKIIKPADTKSFVVQSLQFKNLIEKVAYAAADDDIRPVFTGVYFQIDKDEIKAVSTNTHRMAFQKFNCYFEEPPTANFITPAKFISDFAKYLTDERTLKIEFNDKFVAFESGETYTTARLIEGEFPPYENLLNFDAKIKAVCTLNLLRDVIDRVSVISRTNCYNTIHFHLTNYGLKVFAESSDVGKVEEVLTPADADITGVELKISFNADYISDVLKVLNCEKVLIEFKGGDLEPARIKMLDDDSFIYVLTPVRT